MSELEKFLSYLAEHAHKFVVTMEHFTPCGRQLKTHSNISYDVGTVDRAALMKAYTLHVFEERARRNS